MEDGKKLFFHMTEVHDSIELQPGDEVEFVVVQNQRNAKYSACSLRKITYVNNLLIPVSDVHVLLFFAFKILTFCSAV